MTEASGAAGTLSSLLASAAARVAARAQALPSSTGDQPDWTADVPKGLEELQGKVQEALTGGDPEPLRAWATSNAIARPLARALALELTREAPAEPASAADVLAALRLLAAVQGDPLSAADPKASESEDLETAMRGGDAFELLIEIAHDFRSPLTSILFLAEALRDGHSGPVTEVQKGQLGLIYSAAFALASIASDVMDLAHRRRDLTSDEVEAFLLSDLFLSVERMVRPIVEEKNLELKIVVPERGRAYGHRHALSRVLLNLTTNALKFTEAGSVELGVRPVPHGRLEYYVRDTGRGIPPEEQERLFQPFRRRQGSTQEGHYFSSSGVGLSISRRLLHAMGSELRLDFSDQNGSQFSFVLPAAPRE